MIERQKRLIEVYEYLRRYFGIHTKTGFAEALHYGRTSMSAAMNGDEKYLTDSLFKNICEAYPGVFDLDYLLTGKGALLIEQVHNDDTEKNTDTPQPEIPDYVQRLCEESARLATRNEMLERQCEKLIAELRDSKDKNEAFLVEIKASQKFNDALVADLRISRTQNDTLIAELRETRKQNAVLAKGLSDALLSIEGMKNQMSIMLSNFNTSEKTNLSTLSVNDEGEPVIMIQVPDDTQDGKKSQKIFNGYIKGNVRFITDQMVQQAIKAFTDKKK